MAGLLLFAAALSWFAICLLFAIFLSKRLPAAWGKGWGWGRDFFITLMTAILLIAPFAKDIAAKRQFDRYCKAAESVSILGTIPAPPELYTSAGEWRLATDSATQDNELAPLVHLADSLVRWDKLNYRETAELSSLVDEHQSRIFEKNSNLVLAEWRSYSYRGGLNRITGAFDECHPKLLQEGGYSLYRQLFAYQK